MHCTFVSPVSCYLIFLMHALYFCQPCLMLSHHSDVCTVLLSALSHVISSFCCIHYTFVSPVSCYLIFLLYTLYFCQPCLMLSHLSVVYTILLSALSHVISSFCCIHYTFVSPVSCYLLFLMYALYFCHPCLMLCRYEDLRFILLTIS